MKLADYQRATVALGFAREPPATLPPGFALYREMIQARLVDMAKVAYARSWRVLGHDACVRSFARFVASEPPSSPHLREVIGAFATFALRDAELLDSAAPHGPDLLCFEACVWEVATAPVPEDAFAGVRELDFEGALVLQPTLRTLVLARAVEEERTEPHAISSVLLVYRRAGDDDVHWYRATPPFVRLLALAAGAPASLGSQLRQVLAPGGEPMEPEALSSLVGDLGVALERGVILGVRAISA